jgi:hypothetical protein
VLFVLQCDSSSLLQTRTGLTAVQVTQVCRAQIRNSQLSTFHAPWQPLSRQSITRRVPTLQGLIEFKPSSRPVQESTAGAPKQTMPDTQHHTATQAQATMCVAVTLSLPRHVLCVTYTFANCCCCRSGMPATDSHSDASGVAAARTAGAAAADTAAASSLQCNLGTSCKQCHNKQGKTGNQSVQSWVVGINTLKISQ